MRDTDPDSDEHSFSGHCTPPYPAASSVFASRVCTRRSEHTARDRSHTLASVSSRILVYSHRRLGPAVEGPHRAVGVAMSSAYALSAAAARWLLQRCAERPGSNLG